MLKLLGCTAVAALLAIVQAGPVRAQSAPPADKAESAPTADKPVADKPVADKPAAAAEAPATERAAAEKEAVRSPAKPAADKTIADTDKPKKKPRKLTRQQELDRSLDTGTVPARYRSQVPKQYQHLIPFARQ